MRILVFVHEYPPVGGGGGRVAQDLSSELDQRGDEIVLITPHLKGLRKEEHINGVRIIRIPSLRREAYRADLLAMGGYVLAGIWAGLRLIRHWRPDVIHAHFAVPSGPIAWLLSHIYSIPYVLTVHLGDVPGGAPEKTSRWFHWILPFTRPIWRDAAKIIAVSEFTRKLALEHYPVDIRVIHNGVNLDKFGQKKIQLQSPPRIIFAGRFMKQKNPLTIVRALAKSKELPWQCVMLGDGPLFETVQREIEHHGLTTRFTLPGWVTPDEVLDWFSKSDILFMPSLSEGLPVVGVQALAMGLAMVVSDIGGFVDLVDNGVNGFLVPVDSNLFVEKLSELTSTSNYKKLYKFREASLEKAQKFELHHIASQYASVFTELLTK